MQCHDNWNYAPEVVQVGDATNYRAENLCQYGNPDRRLQITQTGGVSGSNYKQWVLAAAPGTKIAAACLDYNLRRANNSRPEILAFPGFQVLAAGGDEPAGWANRQCFDLEHDQLIFRMRCNGGAVGCVPRIRRICWSGISRWSSSDRTSPAVTEFGGSALQTGSWLRGTQAVHASAYDPAGAGLSVLALGVNGHEVDRRTNACPGSGNLLFNYVIAFSVCPGGLELATTLDTASPPFVNGKENNVNVVGLDYPGNIGGETRTGIWVDNAPPPLPGFRNAQDPDDPELIRAPASDAHSGIASAKILYRRGGHERRVDPARHKAERR